MNPRSADKALESVINVDIGWIEQLHAAQTKPPELDRSSSNMEMELTSTINTANKRSRMIAAPDIDNGAIGYWDLAAGTMGSWKPELDMCRNAVSLINSIEAIPVPRSSCFIIKKVPAAVNTSPLHKHSSAFSSGPAAAAEKVPAAVNTSPLHKHSSASTDGMAAAVAAEAAGNLSSGAAAVKVKKKRVRPSRRIPTTMVKTDTSNFKAMVQHFTGNPSTSTDITQESTGAPSASSSSPDSTNSASSPSFSKPLPHPVLCKISNSSPAAPSTTASAATAACPSPLLPSSFPSCQYLPELPFMAGSDNIPSFDDAEELTINSLIDSAFFDELWS